MTSAPHGQHTQGASASRLSPSDGVERDAKDRSASVVAAWRGLDWEAAGRGDAAALAALRQTLEDHESVLRFLVDEAGELGQRLEAGLKRFFAQEIAPRAEPVAAAAAGARAAGRDAAVDGGDGLHPRGRPPVTSGATVRMNTGCGNLYVTINESDDGQPFELFNHMGKAGGCAASQNEAIGRLISYALRCGASIEPLIKQLKGISCHRPPGARTARSLPAPTPSARRSRSTTSRAPRGPPRPARPPRRRAPWPRTVISSCRPTSTAGAWPLPWRPAR
jgi:hypothetical protein